MIRRSRAIPLAAAALFAALFLGTSALHLGGHRQPVEVILLDPPSSTPQTQVAQISGAVNRPGVYPIKRGDRVADLVLAAGGYSEAADLGSVDEARRVADGDHIRVPSQPTPSSGQPLVRINHAGRDELLTLPGLTVQQAAFIIASVRKSGPLRSADDLVARKLLGASQAAQLAPLVDWTP